MIGCGWGIRNLPLVYFTSVPQFFVSSIRKLYLSHHYHTDPPSLQLLQNDYCLRLRTGIAGRKS